MNYGRIADAVEFYKERGYVYVEDAPWSVGRDAYYATRPDGSTNIHVFEGRPGTVSFPSQGTDNQYLVASGEQSFLQMMVDGQELKRAICVTPCWRVERYNDWHRPFFMKAELINAHDVDEGHLVHMIGDAKEFFERYVEAVRIVQVTDLSYDIVEKDSRRELGPYGIRMVTIDSKIHRWIYGTACAEPRLSTVMERCLRDRRR